MSWFGSLAAIADAQVRVLAPDRLLVSVGGRDHPVMVDRRARGPRPHELTPPPDTGWLLTAPRLSRAVRDRLEQLGWSWADERDAAVRSGDGRWWRTRPAGAEPATFEAVSTRPGRTDLAVVRLLQTTSSQWAQIALAERIGVSQPAVSQALRRLRARGLVDEHGRLVDPGASLAWWAQHYSCPGDAIETHWYCLDDPWTAAVTVATPDQEPPPALSGALGADVLAPWLAPDRVVAYTSVGISPPPSWVAVNDPTDATVTIVVTGNRDIWWHHRDARPTAPDGTRVQLADPLQVLWDLNRMPTDDPARRDQAASHLTDHILTALP